MTGEIPRRPRRSGQPSKQQLQDTVYVLDFLKRDWVDDRDEEDIMQDAQLLVGLYYDHDWERSGVERGEDDA